MRVQNKGPHLDGKVQEDFSEEATLKQRKKRNFKTRVLSPLPNSTELTIRNLKTINPHGQNE